MAVILDTPKRKRRAAEAFIGLGFALILIGPTRKPLPNCVQCDSREGNTQYVPHKGVEDCPHPTAFCHGYKAGSSNLDHVLELMDRQPNANIGIVNGMSNLVTVDIDVHTDRVKPAAYADVPGVNGGEDVFALIHRRYHVPWPTGCLEVRTPSGGTHLTWRVAPGTQIKTTSAGEFGWSVDIKGSKCYVPAPGTVVRAGYYERKTEITNPGPAPEWLIHHLKITGHFPEPPKPRAPTKPVRLGPASDGRAQGWLQEIADGLRSAQQGTGHDALLVATCQAAKLVVKGYVTEDDARAAVYDAGVNRPRDAAGQRGYPSEFDAAWRSALVQVGGVR